MYKDIIQNKQKNKMYKDNIQKQVDKQKNKDVQGKYPNQVEK